MVATPPRSEPPKNAPTIGGGRYALVGKIAEGGMAGVYRAYDRRLKVWRAIKVLFPDFAARRKIRKRFEAEAQTMAQLTHPHVIRVYDVVTDDALPYMVMELAEGGTLIDWVERYGAMPPRMACQVMVEISQGIEAVHALKVVHRDIKPHNVLITTSGQCKVTDFGIAHVDSADGMTRTGSSMGTIGYMAPEQRANAKAVDERADVYALGATLYKLVTNVAVTDLFLVEHDEELLQQAPAALQEVILKACFHRRERRHASAAEFEEALSAAMATLPPDEEAPSLVLTSTVAPPGSAPRFSAIAPLLTKRGPSGGRSSGSFRTSGSREVSGSFPSYSMPSRELRRPILGGQPKVGTPAYVDRAHSQPEPVSGSWSTLAPENTADERGSDEPEERDDLSHLGVPLLFACTVILVVVVGILGFGSWQANRLAARAESAESALVGMVAGERTVIDQLGATGADTERLAASYLLFFDAPYGAKAPFARAFVAVVEGEAADHLRPDDTSLSAMRVRNLLGTGERYDQAMESWHRGAERPLGKLTISLGLAPSPPPSSEP